MYNNKRTNVCKRGDDMPLLDDYNKTEKINGVIYNMSPSGGFSHGLVNGNIYYSFRKQLKDSICMVSVENLDLYLSEDEYVNPDVMLICDRNQVKKDKYRGVPKFVAETLSPSTAFKDRTVKMRAYAKHGVDEYWIVDPKSRSVEVYYLEDGKYELVKSMILEDDEEDSDYNAKTVITLKAMPSISITLEEIFEAI